jgi:hypothetical protein
MEEEKMFDDGPFWEDKSSSFSKKWEDSKHHKHNAIPAGVNIGKQFIKFFKILRKTKRGH